MYTNCIVFCVESNSGGHLSGQLPTQLNAIFTFRNINEPIAKLNILKNENRVQETELYAYESHCFLWKK